MSGQQLIRVSDGHTWPISPQDVYVAGLMAWRIKPGRRRKGQPSAVERMVALVSLLTGLSVQQVLDAPVGEYTLEDVPQ